MLFDENGHDKRELQYLLYQWQCVLSLCECTSVYPAVPTLTYFGHLLPDRAGTCLWNSTWGTDERERLFFFIPKNKTHLVTNTHTLTLHTYEFYPASRSQVWSLPHKCLCRESAARPRPFSCPHEYFYWTRSGWPASTHRSQSVYGNVSVCVPFAFSSMQCIFQSSWPL